MTMTANLPEQFRGLEEWSSWALSSQKERHAKRVEAGMETLRAFHAAMTPYMEEIIRYLEGFPWGAPLLPADETLFHMGLSYMEAAVPIDLRWTSVTAQDSFPVERLTLPSKP